MKAEVTDMKKIYVEPICDLNFIDANELLTVAGSGDYIAWGEAKIFGANGQEIFRGDSNN